MIIHPATVHFAMVLPLVASVFGLAYLYTRTELMSKIAARTTLVAALAMIAVWYTGSQGMNSKSTKNSACILQLLWVL